MKNLNKNNDINNTKMKKHSFITAQLVVWLLVMLCCFAVVYVSVADKRKTSDENDIIHISNATSYTATAPMTGSDANSYNISSLENLLYVYLNYADYSTPTFTLTADITVPDMAGVMVGDVTLDGWYGIGMGTEHDGTGVTKWFFEGNHHTITFINAKQGLFSFYGEGTVQNLGIKGNIVYSYDENYGAICAKASDVTMTNCYNTATISMFAEDYYDNDVVIGGLVGEVDSYKKVVIQNCYNYGLIDVRNVSVGSNVGGLWGYMSYGLYSYALTISNCYNMGTILTSTSLKVSPLFFLNDDDSLTSNISDCYYLNGCAIASANSTTSGNTYTYDSGTAKTPSELKTIFSNTTGWTQSPSANGGYPYLTGFAAPTTKWLTLKLGIGCTINEVSGEYAIGMDAGQTIDLSTLNISPAITSANLSKASGGGTLSGTTYTFGSTDGVVNVSAATYSVTITVNNSSYGSVSNSSVTVEYGTSITSNSNVLTIGSTKITATPKSSDGQYSYKFSSWTGIPSGKQVVGNVTITANFTRTEESHSLTIVLKSNTEREYIVYILGSNGNPTRQLVMKNGNSYTITGLKQGEKFSILVAETLYTICTFKDTTAGTTETTRKKIYENGVTADTNITITISGAGNVNNWIVI